MPLFVAHALRPLFALAAAFLAVTAALPALGQEPPLPAELTFLSAISKPYGVALESWAKVQIPTDVRGCCGNGKIVSGKHWSFKVAVQGANDADAVVAKLKPGFLANGWTLVKEFTAGGRLLWFHYQKGSVEAWATFAPVDTDRALFQAAESGPPPFTLELTPPAATPEKVDPDKGDFPYLTPVKGMKYKKGQIDPSPFYVTLKDAQQPELVSTGSLDKIYTPPSDLGNGLFDTVYHDALVKAGWTIVDDRVGADVLISAHFTKNGRNVWTSIHKNGESIDFRVADAGAVAKGLTADLAKNCHVALYGIFFDFNMATLKPESDPVLGQILDLLKKDPALKLEIQGHTDNVGNDAYNQTLSESRAKSVVTWLNGKGVAPARLMAKGYGKTRPVAENTTDDGRAKNRRVEIVDPNCVAKSK